MVLNDPRIPSPGFGEEPPFGSAPGLSLGTVGVLSGAVIVVLVVIATGLVTGPWLAASIVSLPVLVLLIRWRLRTEGRRRAESTKVADLPEAEITESEHHEALQRNDREHYHRS